MAKKELTYEEAFNRLQEIQKQIESDSLGIDGLTVVLKEASMLLKICKDKLLIVSEETQKVLNNIQ
ncbi:exodeoxyribonuclease VII small subunit [Bacteroidales bacterium OttesenSCG-928-M11]|nr:exodeoxyribonuclease VII small subunit [Bacteroidales bacterium OttesenSCG-928-M11]